MVVACSGDERRMARDFSAALARYGELCYLPAGGRAEVKLQSESTHLSHVRMLPPGLARERLANRNRWASMYGANMFVLT